MIRIQIQVRALKITFSLANVLNENPILILIYAICQLFSVTTETCLYYCMYYHIKLSKCRTAVRNILPTYTLSKTDQVLRTKRKFGARQIASLLGIFTDGD
jgi:hypothetical protein